MAQSKNRYKNSFAQSQKAKRIPSALDAWENIKKQLLEKKPVVFLDYDGTLTAIVQNPEDAVLPTDMRRSLRALSRFIPVIIISGRDRRDVEQLVHLDNLIYAGSHGFDITGPDGLNMQHEGGINALPALEAAEKMLNVRLGKIKGVRIERKKYAIAVHFRNSASEEIPFIQQAVQRVADEYASLRQTGGKKILELRPDIDWNKGKALLWLLGKLDLVSRDYLPLYIGDDLTDEDAFAVLINRGIGILVGDHGEKSFAPFRLKNVKATGSFLQLLVKTVSSNQNRDSEKQVT